jgi:hypothetical protein
MRKPQRLKPRQKARSPAPQAQAQALKHATPVRTGWALISPVRTGWALILAVATLTVFWPRVIVDPKGELSNPASVAFEATNTGFIPLGFPVMEVWECDISYWKEEPPPAMHKCSPFPDEGIVSETGQRWLSRDGKFITRLEDIIRVKERPITRLNVLIRMSYYSWYVPIRFHKVFGFQSAEGSDGVYYWRQYDPQS